MYVSSRLAFWQALAIVLMIAISMGARSAQAQDNSSAPACCQREKPKTVEPQCKPKPIECCPTQQEITQCPVNVQPNCCPVDPKQVAKDQKAADHAAHEAAEACKRHQKEVEKQQAKLDAAAAHAQHEIDEKQAKIDKRNGEYADANAKLDSAQCCPTEAVAETTPEPEIERAKPEPVAPPAAVIEVQPAPVYQAPQITEEKPQAPEEPAKLPKTASPMELIGLIGLISLSARYSKRYLRR